MIGESFAERYVSMSERYANALADLENLKTQIGELVTSSALSAERVVITTVEAGADMLTAGEILNNRSSRHITSETVKEEHAENRELLEKIFEYRGQLIWWERTIPENPGSGNKVWRIDHNFILGVIPEEVVLHSAWNGPHLHLESKVFEESREHEEITQGTISLDLIKPVERTGWTLGGAQLYSEYALQEKQHQLHLPPERVILGDDAVLDRMMELFADPLLYESNSGHRNLEYPNLLRYLLHTGKLPGEMLTNISDIITEHYQEHSTEYEAAIESRNYWSDMVSKTTPRDSLLRKLYVDAQQDLDIEALYKFRLGNMLRIIYKHLEQAAA